MNKLFRVIKDIPVKSDRRKTQWYKDGIKVGTILVETSIYDRPAVYKIGHPAEALAVSEIPGFEQSVETVDLETLTPKQQAFAITSIYNWRAECLLQALISNGIATSAVLAALEAEDAKGDED